MSTLLSDLSSALAGAVVTAGPGVVRVSARRRLPATGVAWSADGLVVTSHHVVERDEDITVGLDGGATVGASLVGRDPTTDLAVLRLDGAALSPLPWAEPDALGVGHLVLALGRPGDSVLATLGIIGALGGAWRTPGGGEVDRYVQTDVTMYPGFSGGPLVDASGRILGLNTSALLRGTSLAVPAPTVRRVVEAILTHGRVRRGYLGVGAQPVRLAPSLARTAGQETGLLVLSVEPDSPAERGGLYVGDTIVTLDGEPVGDLDALLARLGGDRVGRSVPVRVARGGDVHAVEVTIGERG